MYLVLLDGIPIGLYTAMSDAINSSKGNGDVVVYDVTPNSECCVIIHPLGFTGKMPIKVVHQPNNKRYPK
jgi:hypothetical protein